MNIKGIEALPAIWDQLAMCQTKDALDERDLGKVEKMFAWAECLRYCSDRLRDELK